MSSEPMSKMVGCGHSVNVGRIEAFSFSSSLRVKCPRRGMGGRSRNEGRCRDNGVVWFQHQEGLGQCQYLSRMGGPARWSLDRGKKGGHGDASK